MFVLTCTLLAYVTLSACSCIKLAFTLLFQKEADTKLSCDSSCAASASWNSIRTKL